MAFTRVQGKAVRASGSAVLTFDAPPTVGNAVVVTVLLWQPTVLACTDNYGNTYQTAISRVQGTTVAAILFCDSIIATGTPFTVTVTGASQYEVAIIEVAGASALMVDQTISQVGTSATPSTGTTPAISGTDVFVAAAVALQANQSAITVETVSPTWTQELESLSWSTSVAGEADSRSLSGVAGSTRSCSWVATTSAFYAAVLAVFRVASPSSALRVTQEAIETLTQPTLPATRVSQDIIEVLAQPIPNIRVSQDAVEVVAQGGDHFGTDTSLARVSQLAVETMFVGPESIPALSQVAVEVLFAPSSTQPARLSQVALEILYMPGPSVATGNSIWLGDGGGSLIWIE